MRLQGPVVERSVDGGGGQGDGRGDYGIAGEDLRNKKVTQKTNKIMLHIAALFVTSLYQFF